MACPSCEKNKLVQQGVTMVEQEETVDEDAQIDAVLEAALPKKKSAHSEHADSVMQSPPGCESDGCSKAATVDIHDENGACRFRCSRHHGELQGTAIRLEQIVG